MHTLLAVSLLVGVAIIPAAAATNTDFGPSNPFYSPSSLPFQAPPFDKIKDADYQPAIEAGMAEQMKEVEAIANNPAAPTFDNTIVAMEKSGQLLNRVGSRLLWRRQRQHQPRTAEDPVRSKRQSWPPSRTTISPQRKLFARVKTIYEKRAVAASGSRDSCAWWSAITTSSCKPAPSSPKPTRLR